MQRLEQEEQKLLRELQKVDEVVNQIKDDYASIRIVQMHQQSQGRVLTNCNMPL